MKRTITVAMDPHLVCMSPKKTLTKHFSETLPSIPRSMETQSSNGKFKEENQNDQVPADTRATPKRALPSGLAESFRAVFAAFLWHEGLVYDAMSCSSYLKFNPSLPKQNALMFTSDELRTKSDQLTKYGCFYIQPVRQSWFGNWISLNRFPCFFLHTESNVHVNDIR